MGLVGPIGVVFSGDKWPDKTQGWGKVGVGFFTDWLGHRLPSLNAVLCLTTLKIVPPPGDQEWYWWRELSDQVRFVNRCKSKEYTHNTDQSYNASLHGTGPPLVPRAIGKVWGSSQAVPPQALLSPRDPVLWPFPSWGHVSLEKTTPIGPSCPIQLALGLNSLRSFHFGDSE